jgi:prepilin-type N-terminal cleavage/methylation domain-containing protein
MSKKRLGFTLVELLVVISIIGVLIGLLLPAVQAAREASRRASCLNNEKQISLGLINYESEKGAFPGYVTYLNIPTQNGTIMIKPNWMVTILPMLERSDIYNRLIDNFKKWAVNPSDPTASYTDTYLKITVCPSNMPSDTTGRTPWLAYRGNTGRNRANFVMPANPTAADQAKAAIINGQIISEGVFTDQAALPSWANSNKVEQVVRVGLSYLSSKDGSSTTLLLSEVSNSDTPLSNWALASGNDVGPVADEVIFAPKLGFNWALMDNLNPFNIVQPNTPADKMKANHPSGVVVSFCDGHQTFLKTDIDPVVYMQLMAPNDKGAGDLRVATDPKTGGIRDNTSQHNPVQPLDEGQF